MISKQIFDPKLPLKPNEGLRFPNLEKTNYIEQTALYYLNPRTNTYIIGLVMATKTSAATVGGIAYICFKWFQITADAHPGVSWVAIDQKFCEKIKNTNCQVDHPAKIEKNQKPLGNSSKFLKKWQIVFDCTQFWLDGRPGNE